MYIICEICKRRFNRVTNTHLKTHNISMKLYMELYPDSPILSNLLRLSRNIKIAIGHKKYEL